jgi:outer membrane protein TolC
VEIQLEQAQLGVALAVLNAVTQYETALESKAAADQNVVLATEALRLAQLRYDEGAGILLDVTTAQADLTAASNRAAAARFQVRLAYAQLQLAVGQDDLSAAVTARTQTKWMEDKR